MKSADPEGWKEPFIRGLWSYDMLFGAPRFLLFITLPLFAIAIILPSQDALIAMASVQAVGFGLTQIEPEWATIARDIFGHSGVIEP